MVTWLDSLSAFLSTKHTCATPPSSTMNWLSWHFKNGEPETKSDTMKLISIPLQFFTHLHYTGVCGVIIPTFPCMVRNRRKMCFKYSKEANLANLAEEVFTNLVKPISTILMMVQLGNTTVEDRYKQHSMYIA